MGDRVTVGTLDEMRRAGCLTGKAGTARFLAAHSPTRRELAQVVGIATPPAARRGALRGLVNP